MKEGEKLAFKVLEENITFVRCMSLPTRTARNSPAISGENYQLICVFGNLEEEEEEAYLQKYRKS